MSFLTNINVNNNLGIAYSYKLKKQNSYQYTQVPLQGNILVIHVHVAVFTWDIGDELFCILIQAVSSVALGSVCSPAEPVMGFKTAQMDPMKSTVVSINCNLP